MLQLDQLTLCHQMLAHSDMAYLAASAIPGTPGTVWFPVYFVAFGVPLAGLLSTGFGGRYAGVADPWRLATRVTIALAAFGLAIGLAVSTGFVLGNVNDVTDIVMPLTWLVPMLGTIILLRRLPRVRAALGSANGMARLASTQVFRNLGLVFLILHGRGILPGLFTYPATWGDVAAGVTAPVAAWALWYRRDAVAVPGNGWRRFVIGWNVFGFGEHLVAVFLGTTLFPGPLQLFHGSETTVVFAGLPMALFPTYLVCFADTVHLFLLDVLVGDRRRSQPVDTRSPRRDVVETGVA